MRPEKINKSERGGPVHPEFSDPLKNAFGDFNKVFDDFDTDKWFRELKEVEWPIFEFESDQWFQDFNFDPDKFDWPDLSKVEWPKVEDMQWPDMDIEDFM